MNDATMNGKVDTLDLLRMLLRFQINHVAFSGDLKQFYHRFAPITMESTESLMERGTII